MENVRSRLKLDCIQKDDFKKNIQLQSKLIFSGIHKSYEIFDSFKFQTK